MAVFHAVPAPTIEQLQTVLTRIIKRVMKVLIRKGALSEEPSGIPYLTDTDRDPALAPLHAAACTYRIALGPRAGQKVLTWRDHAVGLSRQEASDPPEGCVSGQGFSMHADVSCGPHQRSTLERLCRYITRPALGHKRLSLTPAGEVVLQLKTPYPDGATGILATLGGPCPPAPAPPHSLSWRARPQRRSPSSDCPPREPNEGSALGEAEGEAPSASTRARLSWTQLLQRVFAIDMASCLHCEGLVTIIASIDDPAVVTKNLAHLGLPTKAPPRAPAQAGPLFQTA